MDGILIKPETLNTKTKKLHLPLQATLSEACVYLSTLSSTFIWCNRCTTKLSFPFHNKKVLSIGPFTLYLVLQSFY